MLPPPDTLYPNPSPHFSFSVFIQIVGITSVDKDVEVLAQNGTEFYRFCLPKHSRVIRKFWKNIGVTNVSRLPEGSYEDTRGGSGPYSLYGTLIGEDTPLSDPNPDVVCVGTKVLTDVKLEG